jgi:hypothetical protein
MHHIGSKEKKMCNIFKEKQRGSARNLQQSKEDVQHIG